MRGGLAYFQYDGPGFAYGQRHSEDATAAPFYCTLLGLLVACVVESG